MNMSIRILASLFLNAVLLLAVLQEWSKHRPIRLSETNAPQAAQSESAHSNAAAAQALEAPSPMVPQPFHWSQLRTESWTTYRDDLLSIGCPKSTVREILLPLILRHFSEKRRTLLSPWVSHFWELASPPRSDWKQLQMALNAIGKQERDAMRDLLKGSRDVPPRNFSSRGSNLELDSQLAFLPDEKQEQIRDILRQYRFQSQERRRNVDSVVDLELVKAEQLAAILTPDELDQLKLRQSKEATLRELDSIDLSEEEVAKIIRIREAAPPDTGEPSSSTDEDQKIEELLGSERARQLKLAEDPDYQRNREVVAQLSDPEQKAAQLLAIQSQFANLIEQLGNPPPDGGMPPTTESPQAQLESIRKSLRDQIIQLTGTPESADLWEVVNKGWLNDHFKAPGRPDPWDDPADPKP